MERLIFGTYLIPEDSLENSLHNAYNNGIRRFDTAQLYKNEAETSKYLSTYDNISLTTKVRHIGDEETTKKYIQISKDNTCDKHLHTILLHRPMPTESWKILLENYNKNTGVSNYNIEHLEYIKEKNLTLPFVNQIEFHPFCPDSLEILEWCKQNDISVQGHTILANGKFFNHSVIMELAEFYKVNSARIMLRWAYQHGIDMVLSTTEEFHIKEWKSVVNDDFVLSDQHMNVLNHLSSSFSYRFYDNSWSPWIWREKVINNKSFLDQEIEKLRNDIQKYENNQKVSELALVFPSLKDVSIAHIAVIVAISLFPPQLMKNKKKLNTDQSYIKYNKYIKQLKNKIFEQRRKLEI